MTGSYSLLYYPRLHQLATAGLRRGLSKGAMNLSHHGKQISTVFTQAFTLYAAGHRGCNSNQKTSDEEIDPKSMYKRLCIYECKIFNLQERT